RRGPRTAARQGRKAHGSSRPPRMCGTSLATEARGRKGLRALTLCRSGSEAVAQPVQRVDGMGRVAGDPAVVEIADGQGIEVVPALAALALGDDEIGVLEH